MSKSEEIAFFSKPFNGPILIFWNLILYTFLCTKIKKITMGNFYSLDACLSPMCDVNNKYDLDLVHILGLGHLGVIISPPAPSIKPELKLAVTKTTAIHIADVSCFTLKL